MDKWQEKQRVYLSELKIFVQNCYLFTDKCYQISFCNILCIASCFHAHGYAHVQMATTTYVSDFSINVSNETRTQIV